MKQKKINKMYYISIVFLFSFFLNTHLFSDLGSVSPTINQHIYPDEWAEAGLENGDLSDDYPVITGTINVYNSGEIQSRINEASNYTGIWRVMLQPGRNETARSEHQINI